MAEDPIEMTLEAFVDYQLTVSHCVAAVEWGTPRPEVREWLTGSLAPLYGDAPRRTLQFVVSITALRRVAQ